MGHIARGGFPLALARASTTSRHRWFDDYVRLTLERDISELSRIRQAQALPSVLDRLAGQTAQVLNISAVAESSGLDVNTSRDYIRLLQAVFLVQLLPAWDKALTSRSASTPNVVGELLKEASWMDGITGAGHWRTYDGVEVDLVIERDDGAVVAVEVKAAARASGDDFRALSKLRDAVGDAFLAGVVFYTGARGFTYGDRLHALPVDRLWAMR